MRYKNLYVKFDGNLDFFGILVESDIHMSVPKMRIDNNNLCIQALKSENQKEKKRKVID